MTWGRAPVALIETVRVRGGAAPLWYLHLRRLVASCRALGIPFPPAFDVPAGGPDRVHRLEVGPKGLAVAERAVGPAEPVRIVTVAEVHRPYPHKTTERAQFDRAAAEARAAWADDALMRTADGHVAECTIWGIFWWEGDRLCAPALDLGVLPGVARARIAELLERDGSGLQERRVPVAGLAGRGPFLANAARGIVPVASVDGQPVTADPRTGALAGRFWA